MIPGDEAGAGCGGWWIFGLLKLGGYDGLQVDIKHPPEKGWQKLVWRPQITGVPRLSISIPLKVVYIESK